MGIESQIDIEDILDVDEFFVNPHNQIAYPNMLNAVSISNQEKSTTNYFVAFSSEPQNCCVGCVDMVDSTKISARISPRKLAEYYEIFLNSMSKIIGRFGGKVIKNVGDCLIYYFPNTENAENSFVNCLNCGLVMIGAQKMLQKILEDKKLPSLNYRVSVDYGAVTMMSTSNSSSIDMIGPPVNMSTKINHHAKPNEFVIGGDLHEIVKKIEEYYFQQVLSYDVGLKYSYPVYRVNRK